jgi:hypothetical protein
MFYPEGCRKPLVEICQTDLFACLSPSRLPGRLFQRISPPFHTLAPSYSPILVAAALDLISLTSWKRSLAGI